MERLDFTDIELEFCPYYYDLKRVAELMSSNKDVFFYVNKSLEDDMTLFDAVFSAFGDVAHCMVPDFNITGRVEALCTNLRKVFKKKDTDSLNKAFEELCSRPKDAVVMGLIESLSKLSSEKQKEIIGHIYGNLPDSDHRVAIELVKRDSKNNSKDQYAYYVCFKNIRSNDKRIVTFASHASAAIYVMNLIDRVVRKDDSSPIDVLKNTSTLLNVYKKIFLFDEELKGLKTNLLVDSDGNFKAEKLRLGQYYSDINKVVNENIREWDYVFPYRCDASTSIRLNPELIKIPAEIIPDKWIIHT